MYNGFGRHHDAKVYYFVAVAGHYYRDYIFANVVHITFHRSQQHLPGSSRTFFFLRLDYGLEVPQPESTNQLRLRTGAL